MKPLMTQLSASHPLITSKPEVTPLEVSSLPEDQPYMITVTLPKLFFKLLDIEQALKFQARWSKINVPQRLLLKHRNHCGEAQKPSGSHAAETNTAQGFHLTGLSHTALQCTFLCAHQGQAVPDTTAKLCLRTAQWGMSKMDPSPYRGESITVARNPAPPWKTIPPTSSRAPLSWVCLITSGRDAISPCENHRKWKLQGSLHLRAAGRGPSRGSVRYTRQHSEDNIIKSLNWIRNHQTHSLRCSPLWSRLSGWF